MAHIKDPSKKGKDFTSKWISSSGKRTKFGKRSSQAGANKKINPEWVEEKYDVRVERTHGGGVGIQTHGNKLAKALNTKTPDHSVYLNEDGYLKGGIKVRS